MLLIACPLALLVIFAGMKLLAQTKREALGNLYKYISIFLVAAGFSLLICISCASIYRCCKVGERMMGKKQMMMQMKYSHGNCGMGSHMGSCNMMHGHGMHMGSCNGGMMMNRGCGSHGMSSSCGMNEGCQEHMEGECHEKMKGHDKCDMMKKEWSKKDSLKKKR